MYKVLLQFFCPHLHKITKRLWRAAQVQFQDSILHYFNIRFYIYKNMIGVNPTKVQLTNEDLSEYEAKKQTWKRVQPSIKGLETKSNNNNLQSDTYRRKEVQSRIGIKK